MHVIARLTPRIEKARIIELEGKPVTMTTAAAVDPPSRHDATDCGIPADLGFFPRSMHIRTEGFYEPRRR